MGKIRRNERCPCGSGEKFKRCHLGNWPPRATNAEVIQSELVAPLRFPELAALIETALGRAGMHPLTVVASVVRRVRERIGQFDMQTDDGLHVRAAGAAILAACYQDGVHDYEAAQVPIALGEEADQILKLVNSRLDSRTGPTRDDALRMLLQMLCTQGTLQAIDAFALFRTLYLLELENFEVGVRESRYDELFQQAYGCSAAEYLALMQGIWTSALTSDFIEPTFLQHSPVAEKLTPIAARILKENSCRIEDVKARVDELGWPGVDGVVAAFFAKYPFIEHRPAVYSMAPHPYIRLFATTAPVFALLELARRRAGRADSAESIRMGERFEAMVGNLLLETFDRKDLVPEHAVDKSGRRGADFILFEPSGATLVQAKIKSLTRSAFYGFDLDALRADARSSIAKSISQSVAYLTWLDSPEAERTLTAEAREVRTRLRASPRLFLLGIVPAMPSVFHVDDFRQMVLEGIQERLKPAEKEWFRRNASRIAGWHVIDSDELACFVGRRGKWGLNDALVEYVSVPEFGRFLVDDRFIAPFRGYVAARGRRIGIEIELPKVDASVQRFLDWTLQLIFHKSLAEFQRELDDS